VGVLVEPAPDRLAPAKLVGLARGREPLLIELLLGELPEGRLSSEFNPDNDRPRSGMGGEEGASVGVGDEELPDVPDGELSSAGVTIFGELKEDIGEIWSDGVQIEDLLFSGPKLDDDDTRFSACCRPAGCGLIC